MTDALRRSRDAYTRLGILRLIEEASQELLASAHQAPQLAERFAQRRRQLAAIPPQLEVGQARVAVVGAVKSGKSTLVNALLGQDVVPRGSGVLTSQVTAVRRSPRWEVRLLWKGRAEVNRQFSHYLTTLGRPGSWDLADPGHRELARELLARGGDGDMRIHEAPLGALLEGFGAAWQRLAGERREEMVPDARDVTRWAASDAVAVYLAGLEVGVVAGDLPADLLLQDCQGADAWNSAHARDLEEAILGAHAVIYVISSRIGLREADHRLLDALGGYGLLELTRFVLNVDLGEYRDGEYLGRSRDALSRHLERRVGEQRVWEFSALQALLEHKWLLGSEPLHASESRLLAAWDVVPHPVLEASREAFREFREELWRGAAGERDRTVLQRARADLRRVLLGVSEDLRAAGRSADRLQQASQGEALLECFLQELQGELDDRLTTARSRAEERLVSEFGRRGAPQRRQWQRRLRVRPGDVAAVRARCDGDPVAALTVVRSAADEEVAALLRETEPLRVNALRNLALDVRAELTRGAAELAAAKAQQLAGAGLPVAEPPGPGDLGAAVSASRPVPRFYRVVEESVGGSDRGRLGRSLGRAGRAAGRGLARRSRGDLAVALLGGLHRLLWRRRLGRAWARYLEQARSECLGPYLEETAAQLYVALATWATRHARDGEGSVPGLLAALQPAGSAAQNPPGTAAPSAQTGADG